ncbi:hypothetical protein MCON_1016 [Methanothrix soehngenii GP6]|jgi:hypothetical protein|uniref:Uncharacterized protein n=1 Tax=Methanothrix soehngenii (strain ATCC 5969 / DSM 3671 / JCM 10134 / NBRC 103675 / OCM 69 / GP-6) TaxID=990316 RepID=F4BZ69_METSG|nr:hypothetical protein MCON_1016 [Methanothrix soehngenii GP6]
MSLTSIDERKDRCGPIPFYKIDSEPRYHKWSFWPGQPLCPITPEISEIWIRRREAKVNWM